MRPSSNVNTCNRFKPRPRCISAPVPFSGRRSRTGTAPAPHSRLPFICRSRQFPFAFSTRERPFSPRVLQQRAASASHTFLAFWDHTCRLIHANLSYPVNTAHAIPSRHARLCATMQTGAHRFTRTHLPRTPRTRDRERVGLSGVVHRAAHTQGTNQHHHAFGEPTCACACGSSALGLRRSHPVHLLDYREMSHERDGSFDRVVSIKMVEAVGLENVDVHWAAIDRVLKRKNAAGKEHGVCDSIESPSHRTFPPLLLVYCSERFLSQLLCT
jgi:hypothetical protein